MGIFRFAKIPVELAKEIRNFRRMRKDHAFTAFGLRFTGQGHMISAYSKMDFEKFESGLRKEVEFVKHARKTDRVFMIDAGANLGFYALVYARIEGVEVLAFEPFPETFRHLAANVERNLIRNVTPVNAGLFSESKEMPIGSPKAFAFYSALERFYKFSDKDQSGCMSVYTEQRGSPRARFHRGDEYKLIADRDRIDFIKIDVEGAELEVLKGLTSVLHRHRPLLKIEFNQAAFKAAKITSRQVLDFISEAGYRKLAYCSSGTAPLEWNDLSKIREIEGSPDLLFYPN